MQPVNGTVLRQLYALAKRAASLIQESDAESSQSRPAARGPDPAGHDLQLSGSRVQAFCFAFGRLRFLRVGWNRLVRWR